MGFSVQFTAVAAVTAIELQII